MAKCDHAGQQKMNGYILTQITAHYYIYTDTVVVSRLLLEYVASYVSIVPELI